MRFQWQGSKLLRGGMHAPLVLWTPAGSVARARTALLDKKAQTRSRTAGPSGPRLASRDWGFRRCRLFLILEFSGGPITTP